MNRWRTDMLNVGEQTVGETTVIPSTGYIWKLQLKLLVASETLTNKTFRYPTKYPGLEVCFVKVHFPIDCG